MKRKVLHLRSSGDILGAENVILEIAKNSEKYGYHSIIGAINHSEDPYPKFLEAAEKKGLETILFENTGLLDFGCAKKIKRYIDKEGIHLLHSHGYKENFYGVISKSKIPKVATNHLWKKTNIKLKIYRLIDIVMLRFFSQIIGVSEELIQEMKGLGFRNLTKIQNGIDTDKFFIRDGSKAILEQYPQFENNIVLGMVSSITKEKNHRIIIECMNNLKNDNLFLLILGDGDLKEELMQLVNKYNLDSQVLFAGRQENVADYLSIFDIYLLPSDSEGLPMSLLEAMACGKAVIASKVGDNMHVVEDRINGLLVSPGNLSEITAALNELVTHGEMRKTLGLKARETVENHFSSDKMTQNYCYIYNTLFE